MVRIGRIGAFPDVKVKFLRVVITASIDKIISALSEYIYLFIQTCLAHVACSLESQLAPYSTRSH